MNRAEWLRRRRAYRVAQRVRARNAGGVYTGRDRVMFDASIDGALFGLSEREAAAVMAKRQPCVGRLPMDKAGKAWAFFATPIDLNKRVALRRALA